MEDIRNVTVVGAGTMGHSLALVFAQGGYEVRLTDISDDALQKALRLIQANLATLVEAGGVREGDAPDILARIRPEPRIEEAARNADFVLEAVVEDAAVKRDLFAALDNTCPPRAILASNTSYIDIFEVVGPVRPDRLLITHWFAPPHIVPLVEVVRGPETSDETVATVKELLTGLGKRPMVLNKFLPGFIINRLQSALRAEALFLLDNGYASAEDIDAATKTSFGLRMPILALIKRLDFAGLDFTQKVLANRPYNPPEPKQRSEAVDRLVAQGRLGVKSGGGFYDYGGRSPEEIMKERDIKLLKLREFLRELGELE